MTIPNLLSSRAKWTIDYHGFDPTTVQEMTGIPIDEDHEFLLEDNEWEMRQWATWFMRRNVPFATIQLPDGRWGMWKHKHIGGRKAPGTYCCGSVA